MELAEAVEYEEFDQPISIIWYVPTEFTGFDGPSVRIHLELQFFIPELTTGRPYTGTGSVSGVPGTTSTV